jgi:hypothetical protein
MARSFASAILLLFTGLLANVAKPQWVHEHFLAE